jgi:hypothetical protein
MNEFPGFVIPTSRSDAHSIAGNIPSRDFLFELEHRTATCGKVEMRAHSLLRSNRTGIFLEQRDRVCLRRELRKALADFAGIKQIRVVGRVAAHLRKLPATTPLSLVPSINPPVMVSSSLPESCSSCRHSSYARSNSGT